MTQFPADLVILTQEILNGKLCVQCDKKCGCLFKYGVRMFSCSTKKILLEMCKSTLIKIEKIAIKIFFLNHDFEIKKSGKFQNLLEL